MGGSHQMTWINFCQEIHGKRRRERETVRIQLSAKNANSMHTAGKETVCPKYTYKHIYNLD